MDKGNRLHGKRNTVCNTEGQFVVLGQTQNPKPIKTPPIAMKSQTAGSDPYVPLITTTLTPIPSTTLGSPLKQCVTLKSCLYLLSPYL